MKKVCQWLCPKRKKAEGPYDVHQETFEMDQNLGEAEFVQKNNNDPTARTIQQQKHRSQSSQVLASQSNVKRGDKSPNLQQDQKKYTEYKNKIQQQPSSQQLHSSSKPLQAVQTTSQQPVIAEPQGIAVPEQQAEPQKPKYNIMPSKIKKKKFNPEDYYFKNQNEQFKVKIPDSIKSQQFNIENCHKCDYFVFDISANIYIDDCSDCVIFAAPVQSSIFVRSCKNMVIVGAAGQFRTYDCHNCHFSIYCKSQPVIESSSNIHFSTLTCPQYPELKQQFSKANLQPWNSNWSQIHNFTKKQGEVHYTLDREPTFENKIDWQRAFKESSLEIIAENQRIVPFIVGNLPVQSAPEAKILLIFSQETSKNDQLIYNWVQSHKLTILRASKTKIGNQKYFTVALLINFSGEIEQLNLEQVGNPTLIQEKDQVQKMEGKYFVTFKDQREK